MPHWAGIDSNISSLSSSSAYSGRNALHSMTRDRALLFIAANVQVAISAPVDQAVNQPRLAMKAEDDVLVLREQ
jgi:hypothetical protein